MDRWATVAVSDLWYISMMAMEPIFQTIHAHTCQFTGLCNEWRSDAILSNCQAPWFLPYGRWCGPTAYYILQEQEVEQHFAVSTQFKTRHRVRIGIMKEQNKCTILHKDSHSYTLPLMLKVTGAIRNTSVPNLRMYQT
jgi:hypothetical protein